MYRIICVLLLWVPALLAGPNFEDCGSKVGKYVSISVSGCTEDQQTCILKRGTNATIEIKFNVEKETSAVTTVVHGVIAHMPVPFPMSNPNACTYKDSGLTCPLSKDGGPYTYEATLFVEKAYPKIAVTVKWELQDENEQDIVCILIPAKIQ